MTILFGIILSLVWIWIYLEVENHPLSDDQGNFHYKEYFTIFGIKLFKNKRKNK
jgi:hypothetical protein